MTEPTSTPQQSSTPVPFVQVIDPNGQVAGIYPLTGSGLRVGSWKEGCQVVLEGSNVARTHALLRWDGARASVLVLSSRYPTTLRGDKLDPNLTYAWDLDQPIEIDSYRLMLTPTADRVPTARPMVAQVVPSTLPKERPDTGPFDVALEPEQLRITPGRPTTAFIRVSNRSAEGVTLGLSVGLIPQEWFTLRDSKIDLGPFEEELVELKVNVDRNPKIVGEQAIEIRVQPLGNTGAAPFSRAFTWVIETFAVAPRLYLEPRQLVASAIPFAGLLGERFSKASARYTIVVQNLSNDTAYYTLSVEGQDPALLYSLDRQQVLINPGDREFVNLRVAPLVPQLEEDRRVHTFAVRAAPDNQPAPEPFYGRFEHVAPGVMLRELLGRFALLFVILLLLLALLRFTPRILAWQNNSNTPTPAPTPTVNQETAIALNQIAVVSEAAALADFQVRQAATDAAGTMTAQAAAIAPVRTSEAGLAANQATLATQVAANQAALATQAAANQAALATQAAANQAAVATSQAVGLAAANQQSENAVGTATAAAAAQTADAENRAAIQTAVAARTGPTAAAAQTLVAALTQTARAVPTRTPVPSGTPQPTDTPEPTSTAEPPRPTKLLFGTTPGEIRAGEVISPEISVFLVDDGGHVVPVGDVPVTLTLVLDPDLGDVEDRLLGDTRVRAENGIATFDRLRIQLVGRYKLVATSPGLESKSSPAFTIKAAEASDLVFTRQPVSGRGNQNIAAGEPFTVTVTALDEFGNIDTEYQDSALGIELNQSDPPNSLIVPSEQQSPYLFTSGILTFTNIYVTHRADGYRIKIVTDPDTGLTATSDSFNIRRPKIELCLPPQESNSCPSEVEVDNLQIPQVKMRILDSNDQLISNFIGTVTLVASDLPAGASLSEDSFQITGGTATVNMLSIQVPACNPQEPCTASVQLEATLSAPPDDTAIPSGSDTLTITINY